MRTTKKFLRRLDKIFDTTYPVISEDDTTIVRYRGIGEYWIEFKTPLTKDSPPEDIRKANFNGDCMPDIDRFKNELLTQIKAELKLKGE